MPVNDMYCPNCGEKEHIEWIEPDHDSFYFSWLRCYECGLNIFPGVRYMDLEELNIFRRYASDLPEKKVLPKRVFQSF